MSREADRAALVDALRVCRRWIVEGQAQIGWSVDRIDEVLAAAALAAPPEAAPAPDCRAAVRAAVEAGWDDGVRFASEVLRSQVYPKAEARQACVERVLAILDAKLAALEDAP